MLRRAKTGISAVLIVLVFIGRPTAAAGDDSPNRPDPPARIGDALIVAESSLEPSPQNGAGIGF
jgi:hypothetical protein